MFILLVIPVLGARVLCGFVAYATRNPHRGAWSPKRLTGTHGVPSSLATLTT